MIRQTNVTTGKFCVLNIFAFAKVVPCMLQQIRIGTDVLIRHKSPNTSIFRS